MKLKSIAQLGILVSVATIATIVYIMRVSNILPERSSIQARGYLESASGLREESPVYLRGVAVGEVDAIELDSNRVVVRFSVEDIAKVPIDSKIRLYSSGLLGSASLEIIPGSAGSYIQDNAVLQYDGSGIASLNSTLTSFEPITENLNAILEEIKGSLAVNIALVEETLLGVRDLIDTSNSVMGTFEENFASQLESISNLIDVATRTVSSVDSLLVDNNEGITQSIDSLNTSLEEIKTLVASINSGEGSLGKLVTDDTLYDSLVKTSDSARNFVDNTLGPELQIGYRAEVMTAAFEDVSVKSHVDLRLIPPGNKSYYQFSLVTSPRKITESTNTIIRESVNGAPETTTVRDIESSVSQIIYPRFSAQIARNFFDNILTLRGGLIENTAGFGFEVRPIPQLEFGSEIFNITKSGAYLRSYATAYPFFDPRSDNFFKWLYVSVGVDDILELYKRQYYVGIGLRLSDDYLKSLVGLAPLFGSLQ